MNGNAEINRHANVKVQGPDFRLVLRTDAAAQCDGLLRIRLRQQESEFVASNTKRKIKNSHGLAKHSSSQLKHLVTLQVAAPIVHFFQFVKIQNDDREMLTVSFRPVQFFVEIFVEEPAIVESSQRIRRRVNLQFFEILVFHHDGNAEEVCGGENIQHRGLQRNSAVQAFREFAAMLQNAVPILIALRVG